jgi:hypothetical protein
MNTFLPFANFDRSAECLDRARLGKQRVEVLQLLRALSGETQGWRNHPAAKMWRGHEATLAYYGVVCCQEWIRRGYKDTCLEKIAAHCGPITWPRWFDDEAFHESHRSNLLRKDFAHYSKYFIAPLGLPYIWPEAA